MRCLLILILIFLSVTSQMFGRILKVGSSFPYATISLAANIALPGDSIVCYDAVIQGGMYISNLQGRSDQWIYILSAPNTNVIIRGGNNSIQFSDAAYLHIEGFIIESQTGNGLNIDDAGSFDTPTHHIHIVGCTIRDINATGNNDLLKLSGLNDFVIRNCTFLNGSQGGSGIDMVGCHRGRIIGNAFQNMGSNSIQAKGGTSDIEILRNTFQNGGARALNLGGSTGLAFFRPQNATAEAERIKVIANVIEGSEAAVAFVGCRNVDVSNNTILFPRKWIIRILQETVDPARFLPCGDNSFFNNLVVIDQNVSIDANIGPNTAPETFTFSKNLWWKTSNPSWNGPNLPGQVNNNITADPLIIQNSKYRLPVSSPAVAKGLPYHEATLDIDNQPYNDPPSLGAFEARKVISGADNSYPELTKIYPNPVDNVLHIRIADDEKRLLLLCDMLGKTVMKLSLESAHSEIDVSPLISGDYLLMIFDKYGAFMSTHKVIIQ